MDYERRFEDAITRLKAEERYRIFANLERDARRFPMAMWRPAGEEDFPREVTVWCSNDYLGMGGHADVIEASVRAARAHGAGAGGTRNISGTHHPIVQLEAELADLHRKPASLVFTSGWISNLAGISTIASAAKSPSGARTITSAWASTRRSWRQWKPRCGGPAPAPAARATFPVPATRMCS